MLHDNLLLGSIAVMACSHKVTHTKYLSNITRSNISVRNIGGTLLKTRLTFSASWSIHHVIHTLMTYTDQAVTRAWEA